MNILLHDGKKKIVIGSDERSFTICEERLENGRKVFRPVAWYADLAALFTALLHRKVRNSNAKTLQELKEAILTAKKELGAVWALHCIGQAA